MAHPIFPDSLGTAHIGSECGPGTNITGYLWDDGSTNWETTDLPMGWHWVILFENTDPVDTFHFEVEQLQWQTSLTVSPILTTSWTELDHCGTSIFNVHKCTPDPDSTVIYLLQNGVAIDSALQISCPIEILYWPGVAMGYTYQTYIVDHGSCGSYAYSPLISTFSLVGASLILQTNLSTNGASGSIEVLEVVPDPNSTLPQPPSPITGTFTLLTLPDLTPIADQQNGTTAFWDGLAPGEYLITFNADSLSDQVTAEVTIDMSTGLNEYSDEDHIVIWPVPVQDILHWNCPQATPFHIHDIHGRVVLKGGNEQSVDVSGLAPGVYSFQLNDGRSGKFIKR